MPTEAEEYSLILKYRPLAISIARRYSYPGLSEQDLIQEGMMGLIKASQKFSSSHKKSFPAYARWWITSYIQLFVLKNYSIVSYGQSTKDKKDFFYSPKDPAAEEEAEGDLDSQLSPLLTQISSISRRLKQMDIALDEFRENGVGGYSSTSTPETDAMANEMNRMLRERLHYSLKKLSKREKQIIYARYLADESKTLEELGRELQLSRERVRQLEHSAFKKLTPILKQFYETCL